MAACVVCRMCCTKNQILEMPINRRHRLKTNFICVDRFHICGCGSRYRWLSNRVEPDERETRSRKLNPTKSFPFTYQRHCSLRVCTASPSKLQGIITSGIEWKKLKPKQMIIINRQLHISLMITQNRH